MINITLPDGSQRQFEHSVTVQDVASSIGAGLAKAALAGKVDGKLVDTSYRIERDANARDRHRKAPRRARRSCATPPRICWRRPRSACIPDTQVTIGPVIDNGFYYDFARTSAVHAGRPREDRGGDEEDRRRSAAGRAQRDGARRRGRVLQAARASTTRPRSSTHRSRRARTSRCTGRASCIDLCRGPHVPTTEQARARSS